MVADNDSGESIPSEVRTSSGMFLKKSQVCFMCILSLTLFHVNYFYYAKFERNCLLSF